MSRSSQLRVELVGDAASLKRALGEAERGAETMRERFERVGGRLQAFGRTASALVTAPIVGIGIGAVRAASNVEEMYGKFNTVFGGLSRGVEDWARDHAQATNRSRYDLMGYAAQLQDTFVPMGIARDEAAEMSKTIAGLGVDLASFNNEAEPDVVNALTSALVGNHGAVQRFGIILNDATMNAELLRMGIEGGTRAATEAEKMQARMNIIMASTADAQGDAARTSDSFANQMRGLKAALQETAVAIGQHLLPLATKLVQAAQPWIARFGELSESGQRVVVIVAGIAAAIGPLLIVAGTLIKSMGAVVGVMGAVGAPVIAVVAGLAALTAGLVIAYQRSETFRNIVNGAFLQVQRVATVVFAAVGDAVRLAWERVIQPAWDALTRFVSGVLVPAFQTSMRVAQEVWQAVSRAVQFAWEHIIRPAWQAIGWMVDEVLAPKLRFVRAVAEDVWGLISTAVKVAWEHVIKPAWTALRDWIDGTLVPRFQDFRRTAEAVWEGVRAAVDTAWQKVRPIFEAVHRFVAEQLTPVWDAFSGAADSAWGKLSGIISRALQAVGGPVAGFLRVVSKVAEAVGMANLAQTMSGAAASAEQWGQPVRRNRGGRIPGAGPDRDSVPALLTPGEFVWSRKAVNSVGIDTLEKAHALARMGRRSALELLLGGDPWSPGLAVYNQGGAVSAAQSWARGQNGKPYVWGGVGPRGYDCSGFMSAIHNVLLGRNPHRRLYATSSFAGGRGAAGLVPGLGSAFAVGVVQGSPGHMSGTLGGLNVESRGSRGVIVGPGARGADDRLYTHRYHLPAVGGQFVGGGEEGIFQRFAGWFTEIRDHLRQLAGFDGGAGLVGQTFGTAAVQVGRGAAGRVVDEIPLVGGRLRRLAGLHEGTYDQGGELLPGTTIAHNLTGRAERITGPSQHQELLRELRALRRTIEQGHSHPVHLDGDRVGAALVDRIRTRNGGW